VTDGNEARSRTRAMFDGLAKDYDQSGVGYFGRFGADLVRRAQIRAGDRVLDVGAGRGAAFFPAVDEVGPTGHVTAIDLSEEMVAALRRDAAARGLNNVTVAVGDAEDPDVEPASIDVVLAALVFFFVLDPTRALSAARAALRTGGRLAFTTFGPLTTQWAAVYDAVSPMAPNAGQPRPGHGSPLWDDPDAITAWLSDAGFVDVSVADETFDIGFDSPEHWYHWTWTVGIRALWLSMDESTRERARLTALDVVGSFARDDGSVTMPERLRFAIARRG
jgi:ubiquinone/menaquinone biosynthesis C-methylase UbiE